MELIIDRGDLIGGENMANPSPVTGRSGLTWCDHVGRGG